MAFATYSNFCTFCILFLKCMFHFCHCSFKFSDWSVSVEQIRPIYDYIIVGAGSAGCRLANKLSEKKHLNILVLEAGSTPPDYSEIPGFASYAIETQYDWNYQLLSQEHSFFAFVNKTTSYTSGKVVGGTSVIDHIVYQRGNQYDYDNWQSKFGAVGWNWKCVLPLLMKDEANDNFNLSSRIHGRQGDLCVSSTKCQTPLLEAFLNAGERLDYKVHDVLDGDSKGFFELQSMICNGTIRCSSAKAFIQSIVGRRQNLHLSLKSLVTKIQFNSRRASGVKFERGGKTFTVLAAREIILSAGVFRTPQLLMLSGIGPQEHLKKFNIPVIANLPVGENLEDHVGAHGIFGVGPPGWRMDMTDSNNLLEYFHSGTGPLTSPNGAHYGIGYVTTKYATNNIPDVELIGQSSTNTISASQMIPEYKSQFYAKVGTQGMYNIVPAVCHPKSKGWVRLNSTNMYDQPLINPRYFAEKLDLDILVEGLKTAADMIRSKPFQDLNITLYDVPFPPCKNYTFASDDYMICLAVQFTFSMWHACGTCRMGDVSRNDTVVDSRLRVKGIERLRIADASVMPQIITGHTTPTCIMIGSKAGDLILENMVPRIIH